MNLFCLGTDFNTSEVTRREKLAYTGEQVPAVLKAVSEALGPSEVVLLSTCNRTEFYVATSRTAVDSSTLLKTYLKESRQLDFDLDGETYFHEGAACVAHLFAVASGLRSMVVGETEIFGQTKEAYGKASLAGHTGKFLNKLFQFSFAAAKEARTHSGIGRGSVSVASVAIDLAEQIFGSLKEVKAMVLGAGETGERVARTLADKGVAKVMVSNRTYEKAEELAKTLSGVAIRWEEWEKFLIEADVVIASTAAPHFILYQKHLQELMPRRSFRPIFLIDLAIPRDIEPTAAVLDSVYLYDVDDLQSIASQHLAERQQEIENCKTLLKVHEQRYADWYERAVQHGKTGFGNLPSSSEAVG